MYTTNHPTDTLRTHTSTSSSFTVVYLAVGEEAPEGGRVGVLRGNHAVDRSAWWCGVVY